MAYQAGTVASPTALKTVIETFCTDNGWTLSGSDYLYKGESNVKLTVTSSTILSIVGARSSTGTEVCPFSRCISIPAEDWPVTYYIFANTIPDIIVCVLQYATSYIQPIIFGDIVKVHASAFVGGNWFFAPRTITYPSDTKTNYIGTLSGVTTLLSDSPYTGSYNPYTFKQIPFAQTSPGFGNGSDGIYAAINGTTWASVADNASSTVYLAEETVLQYHRSPNTWNSQSMLVPIHIEYTALSGFRQYLGYVEHLRLIRIDNYSIGDIVTLGSDKWKVFPWVFKDTVNRNGSSSVANSSGTFGFAIRYDGP